MTKKKAEKLILKWLNQLLLDDYTIQFTVERPTSINSPEFVHRTENACVVIEPNKGAHIQFNSDNFRNLTEETIIHECCHILFANISLFVSGFGGDKYKKYDSLEESAVQHLTRVLYRKKRK